MCVCKTEEVSETQSPLLNTAIQSTGGKVIHPGNTTLLSLNLSGQSLTSLTLYLSVNLPTFSSFLLIRTGNKLTQWSLQIFLSSVECQGQRGLQYLSLNVRFTHEYLTIKSIRFQVRLYLYFFFSRGTAFLQTVRSSWNYRKLCHLRILETDPTRLRWRLNRGRRRSV